MLVSGIAIFSMKASASDKSRFFSWETLVVVWAVFLGGGAILVGGSIVQNPAAVDAGRIGSVRASLPALTSVLRLYAIKVGRLPAAEQGLAALVEKPVVEPVPQSWAQQLTGFDVLKEPWDNEYVYTLSQDGEGFQLDSGGPDSLDRADDDITWPNVTPALSRRHGQDAYATVPIT